MSKPSFPSRFVRAAPRCAAVAVAFGLLCAVVFAGAQPAAASNLNAGVVEPNQEVSGMTYAEWGRDWWEWALSYPSATNPILDLGPDVQYGDANEQPAGDVWFLVGTFGGSADRNLDVPDDKYLFVPLFNMFVWSPEDCWWLGASTEPDGCSAKDLKRTASAFAKDIAPGMSASLDGVELVKLDHYRAQLKDPFTYSIEAGGLAAEGYALGDRYPTVADGYYLMLEPLDEGEHTLTFAVEGFLDVIYHLTVTE